MNDVELVILTISFAVFSSLLIGGALVFYVRRLRISNIERRQAILDVLRTPAGSPRSFVGFFHPYCNAGGGGELVLWTAIKHIQTTEQDVICVVYTGDLDASKNDIITKVHSRFNISLAPETLHFVYLQNRSWVGDKSWPRFTLALQSLGSMYLAWEAMSKLIPDLFIDTMGYAFTFHVVGALGGVPVGAYVHYPTISANMIERVASRKAIYNNTGTIASSSILSYAKLVYYRIFAFFYAQVLRKASFLMVNSTWTKTHVDAILSSTDTALARAFSRLLDPFGRREKVKTRIVFPPCDTTKMARADLGDRQRIILSVAQFRPEKNLPMQVHALAGLLEMRPGWRSGEQKVQLVLLGGARNDEDWARVAALEALAKELGVEDNVLTMVNAAYIDLLSLLANASVGISTMVDEHFGINVVEYMAAGLIPVVNESGGPLLDIVVPFDGKRTGFHATDAKTYAAALEQALSLSPEDDLAMRKCAREHAVRKFAVPEFTKAWGMGGWTDWRRAVRAQRAHARAAVEQKKQDADTMKTQ